MHHPLKVLYKEISVSIPFSAKPKKPLSLTQLIYQNPCLLVMKNTKIPQSSPSVSFYVRSGFHCPSLLLFLWVSLLSYEYSCERMFVFHPALLNILYWDIFGFSRSSHFQKWELSASVPKNSIW